MPLRTSKLGVIAQSAILDLKRRVNGPMRGCKTQNSDDAISGFYGCQFFQRFQFVRPKNGLLLGLRIGTVSGKKEER